MTTLRRPAPDRDRLDTPSTGAKSAATPRRCGTRLAHETRIGVTAIATLVAGTACADMVLAPEPANDAVVVAHAAWSEIDAYFPFFERNGVDWDEVGERFLPHVRPATTDIELFVTLREMIAELKDGHTGLLTPLGQAFYDGWRAGKPENFFPDLLDGYLRPPSGSAGGSTVRWAMLDGGLGYLRISSFGPSGIGDAVDRALEAIGDAPGIVIDVRSNGGGSDTQSDAAAGRFTERRVHYRTYRYKAGPAHDDFGPERKDFIEPAGDRRYDGPVVVLQNRTAYSATEDFILAMRVRPDVTFVGDTTGGGAGNPIPRELPNGWLLRVSRWQSWAADGTWYEGIGLAPDVVAGITEGDRAEGRDPILERAIAVLSGS